MLTVFINTSTRGLKRWLKSKSACCSCRELGPGSQHLLRSSVMSLTQVPGEPIMCSGLCGYQACIWYIHAYKQTKHLYNQLQQIGWRVGKIKCLLCLILKSMKKKNSSNKSTCKRRPTVGTIGTTHRPRCSGG